MGKQPSPDTREQIIIAARDLFVRKGMDGVNMRELADAADVNKGLLHYYFKTKDAIFREVFQHQAGKLYAEILHILQGPGTLDDKVGPMVDRYFAMLSASPSLPAFVLFTMQKDPGMIANSPLRDLMLHVVALIEPQLRGRKLPKERASGIHFLLDMVSLCAFTFATLPAVGKALKLKKADQAAFLALRKKHIVSVLKQSFHL